MLPRERRGGFARKWLSLSRKLRGFPPFFYVRSCLDQRLGSQLACRRPVRECDLYCLPVICINNTAPRSLPFFCHSVSLRRSLRPVVIFRFSSFSLFILAGLYVFPIRCSFFICLAHFNSIAAFSPALHKVLLGFPPPFSSPRLSLFLASYLVLCSFLSFVSFSPFLKTLSSPSDYPYLSPALAFARLQLPPRLSPLLSSPSSNLFSRSPLLFPLSRMLSTRGSSPFHRLHCVPCCSCLSLLSVSRSVLSHPAFQNPQECFKMGNISRFSVLVSICNRLLR